MSNRSPEAEAHVFAEVYKTVYAAHIGKFEVERRREAENTARDAVRTFVETQPKSWTTGGAT